MARTRTYNHFCPVARSLEVIGEKWSLLIVRDLLRGPQRFTDLLRGLNNITPKWLTLRLRELESAGIVEPGRGPGRGEARHPLAEQGAHRRPAPSGARPATPSSPAASSRPCGRPPFPRWGLPRPAASATASDS